MNKTTKHLLLTSLLLSFYFWAYAGGCVEAAPQSMYQISETELSKLETNLAKLKQSNAKYSKELKQQQSELEASREQLAKLREELEALGSKSRETEQLLKSANASLKQYAEEEKHKRLVIKRQRNLYAFLAVLTTGLLIKAHN